ncbi:MAG: hypothetical protein H6636_11550 [Anaerolineales bacterium]|nr:hypothetical protein [Anaerolineales bacterium]
MRFTADCFDGGLSLLGYEKPNAIWKKTPRHDARTKEALDKLHDPPEFLSDSEYSGGRVPFLSLGWVCPNGWVFVGICYNYSDCDTL